MTRTLSQCAANTAQQTSDILIKVILNIYKIITLVININDKLLKYNQFYQKIQHSSISRTHQEKIPSFKNYK